MEAVLKRALRCALEDKESDYDKLLAKANLSSLEAVRKRAIAIEVYKTLQNQNPVYLNKFITVNNNRYNTRQPLFVPRVSTVKYGQRSLRYMAPKIWNSLPEDTRQQPTLDLFKRSIRAWPVTV